MNNKLIAFFIFHAFLIAALVGFVGPWAVSYPDTIVVAAGFLMYPLLLWYLAGGAYPWFKRITKPKPVPVVVPAEPVVAPEATVTPVVTAVE